MNIVDILLIATLVLTIEWGIMVAQAFALNRILPSWAWKLWTGFLCGVGGLQVYGFIRLPSAILQAKVQGVLPEHLTVEQWIRVALAVVVIGTGIAAQHVLRHDLKKIGL